MKRAVMQAAVVALLLAWLWRPLLRLPYYFLPPIRPKIPGYWPAWLSREVMSQPYWWAWALVIGGLVIAAWWQGRRTEQRWEPSSSHVHGSARWRSGPEVRRTLVKIDPDHPHRAGVVVGSEDGRAWLTRPDVGNPHVLLIGATRSGKTRRVILPTIWTLGCRGESMIVSDPKGELYATTAGWLVGMGYRVVRLDFREPRASSRWNPLQQVADLLQAGDIAGAGQAAWDLGHVLAWGEGRGHEPYWQQQAESLIAALALAVAGHAPPPARHLASAYRLLIDRSSESLDAYFLGLKEANDPAWPPYGAVAVSQGNTRAGINSTATANLRLWSNPAVADMTAASDFPLDLPGREKTAIFVVVPDERQTLYPLVTLFLTQSYHALALLGRARPTWYLLDEFGNLPPIPDFAQRLTVSAGRGIRFVLAVQSLAQVRSLYGGQAETIMGNCDTWMYLRTSDPETARIISAKTGQATAQTYSRSTGYAGRTTESEGVTGRPLLTPDEVMRWPIGQALVLQAGEYPAKLPLADLSSWRAAERAFSTAPAPGPLAREAGQVPVWAPDSGDPNKGGPERKVMVKEILSTKRRDR